MRRMQGDHVHAPVQVLRQTAEQVTAANVAHAEAPRALPRHPDAVSGMSVPNTRPREPRSRSPARRSAAGREVDGDGATSPAQPRTACSARYSVESRGTIHAGLRRDLQSPEDRVARDELHRFAGRPTGDHPIEAPADVRGDLGVRSDAVDAERVAEQLVGLDLLPIALPVMRSPWTPSAWRRHR